MRLVQLIWFCALFLLIPSGCTNTVIPPPAPQDPVMVHLLDHGRHPSLVLPREDGSFVRYVFGDWRWYALGDTGFFEAFDAMLLPGNGALGRRILESEADFDQLRRRDPTEHAYAIRASRADVAALDQRLNALFERNVSTLHVNRAYDLAFVHHPERYWFFHNCNHEMKAWLQSLNCDVRGTAALSNWKIREP